MSPEQMLAEPLPWLLAGSVIMVAVAMTGAVTLWFGPQWRARMLLPLVAVAAGTLLGGAFFHMLPHAAESLATMQVAAWLVAGFATFLALEQFLHWHHSHGDEEPECRPVTYLLLIGDAAHNFLGGIGVASTFLIDPRAGVVAFAAAVAHEVPQELGDFGVLVHSGWSWRQALTWNVVSALTFPVGAVLAYLAAQQIEVAGLVCFAAGNFLYIAASDLIPEIKGHANLKTAALHFACFAVGVVFMYALANGPTH